MKSPAAAVDLGVSRIKGLVSVTLTVTVPPETVKAADSGCFPTLYVSSGATFFSSPGRISATLFSSVLQHSNDN